MMRFAWLLVVLGCAHAAPPRATAFGKRVGLGELVGDREATALLKESLGEAFDLNAPNPELHLHVDATTSGYDEQVVSSPGVSDATRPQLFRRVQTMHVTIRMVEDATGEVLALGVYEGLEKGPEQPREAYSSGDLVVILARRMVRTFVETHHF